MAHTTLPEGIPGMIGPMAFNPATAKPLNELAEALLLTCLLVPRTGSYDTQIS